MPRDADNKVISLVVHHTATNRKATVEDIRRMHKERGWRDVGYHVLVRQPEGEQPKAWHGRRHNMDERWDPWERGAHTKGHNRSSVGFALVGNYHEAPPPHEMLEALADQLAAYAAMFGLGPSEVYGHREMPGTATVCPGDCVDMNLVRTLVAERLA